MVKNSKPSKYKRFQQYVTPGLLIIFIIAIITLGGWIKALSDRIDQLDNAYLQNILVSSLEDVSQPVATEPASGEVFFHEAHVKLPIAPDGLKFKHTYTPASDDGSDPASIELSSPSEYQTDLMNLRNARDMKTTFSKLAQLQQCSRAYKLVFGTVSDENYTLKSTIHLSDDRAVSIYANKACDSDNDKLLPYFAQMQSY